MERYVKKFKESDNKEFKKYNDFLKFMKQHNLKWNDKGPFIVFNKHNNPISYATVGEVLEAHEE
jgi:hypothetical protein